MTIRVPPEVQYSPAPTVRHPDIWERTGDWLQRHQGAIRFTQWTIVGVYAVLLVVPVLLPLPDNAAYLWTDFTRVAQLSAPIIIWRLLVPEPCAVSGSE